MNSVKQIRVKKVRAWWASPLGWLASIMIAVTTGIAPLAAATAKGKASAAQIVFLVSEDPDNYEATKTIPPFADMLQRDHNYRTTVLHRTGPLTAASYPGLAAALAQADLLVIFTRRVALPKSELDAIRKHIAAGKPLIGIRTANHGFAPRGEIAQGHEAWVDFVPDLLGAINRGYGKVPEGSSLKVQVVAKNHPILQGINAQGWTSQGSQYLTAPLVDQAATVLLNGEVNGRIEPIAWTRRAGSSRVFYTSLGFPADFDLPQFRTLLINGIRWSLDPKSR